MDLLTVVSHEIGHVLGFDHDEVVGALHQTLSAGTRIAPEHTAAELQAPKYPGFTSSQHTYTTGIETTVARTAQVGDDVVLGDRVKVEARAKIGDGTTIGAGTTVGKGAQIGARVLVGENVVIDAGAVIPDDAVVLSGSRVSAAHGSLREHGAERFDLRARLRSLFQLEDDDAGTSGRKSWFAKRWLH
jgi:NDP-sugar pyrophosphorylase family protein